MKLMIDTNIILDALFDREPFTNDSLNLFITAANNEHSCYMTAKCLADIYYIIRKQTHDEKKSREIIGKLLKLFNIISITEEDCLNALINEGNDYEDNLVISAAIRCKADYILTRNEKHFAESKVPALTAGLFFNKYELKP